MKSFNLFDIDEPTQQLTQDIQDIADTRESKPIYNPVSSQREAEAQHRAVYAAHQDAIHRAGQCREEINKGILNGESPYNLLLKAIECISLTTGEPLFYNQNKEQIKAIYGAGLLEALPLELELAEVQNRLKMLQRSELESEPANSRERIRQAVKWHKQREIYLINLLGE